MGTCCCPELLGDGVPNEVGERTAEQRQPVNGSVLEERTCAGIKKQVLINLGVGDRSAKKTVEAQR